MINQAIILAGGRGERLRPLTSDRPKSMVEARGRPLLDYQLHWLKSQNVLQVQLACGYLSEVIEDFCGDGKKWGIKISYSVEPTPLGRGGALKQALKSLNRPTEPILCFNGDIVFDLDLKELVAFHNGCQSTATVVCVPLKSPYGVIDLSEDCSITRFREKPTLPFWVNAGIYILEPEIFDLLPDTGDHEETTFPNLCEQKRLYAFKSKYFWQSVETIKDLKELSTILSMNLPEASKDSGAR